MNNLADVLIDWYERNGRDLPWRQTTDPYKIWISEIIYCCPIKIYLKHKK